MAEYIDKEKLLDRLRDIHDDDKTYRECFEIAHWFPTKDVAPIRHGKWIVDECDSVDETRAAFIFYHCSECGYELDKEQGEYDWCYGEKIPENYCPNCGARMDGEK